MASEHSERRHLDIKTTVIKSLLEILSDLNGSVGKDIVVFFKPSLLCTKLLPGNK